MFGMKHIVLRFASPIFAGTGGGRMASEPTKRSNIHHHHTIRWRARPKSYLRIVWLGVVCCGLGTLLGAFWIAMGACDVQ